MRPLFALKGIVFLLFICVNFGFAQLPYPLPAAQDTAKFGKYLQRTMKLLATSTPTKRNTVKILVYGQSIAKQEWSDTVRTMLKKRYPNANIIMVNRSIGGCWAGCLQDPMEYDVNPFYPDLILFDVYGWNPWGGNQGPQYEGMIKWFRTHTTAEVAMQNHHVTPGDAGNGVDNAEFLRMANENGVELIDVRTPWFQYLTATAANDLTSDGTHLNDQGNFLMARLYFPYLQYKPQFISDTFQLVKTYKVGQDVFWVNGKITLPFNGNRVDVVNDIPVSGSDSAKIWIDNKRPSTIPGTVMFTRPNEPYDTVFKHFAQYDWPWQKGSIMKFTKPTFNPKAEKWTLEFLTYNAGSNFTYKVTGSKTGLDGNASASIDFDLVTSGSAFNSTSGTVKFNSSSFWFSSGPYSALPLAAGFQISWYAKAFYTNTFVPNATNPRPAVDSVVTLAQGITNANHTLEITAQGAGNTPIKEIKVYRPYVNRVADNFTITAPNLVVVNPTAICLGNTVNLTTTFTDIKSIAGIVTYWKNASATISVTAPNLVSIAGNYFIKKQAIVMGVSDIKTVTVSVFTCQPNLSITNPAAVCIGSTANITTTFIDLNSIAGTVTYWKNAGATLSLATPTAATAPGIYFIKKTGTVGGQSDIKSVTVSAINCQPILSIVNPPATCLGFLVNITNTFTDVNSITGTIQYWKNAGATITLTAPNMVSIGGIYFIKKIATTGGLSDIKSVTVTINALPTVSGLGVRTICSSLSTSISATGANTYNWLPGNLSGIVNILSPTNTSAITITGTNGAGCSSSAIFTITVNSLPSIAISGATSVCTGSSTLLTVSGANAYSWQPGALSGNVNLLSPTSNTTYSIVGTNTLGCVGKKIITITVSSSPFVAVNGSLAVCIGSATTLTGSGTSTFTWLPGNLIGDTQVFNPASNTSYTLTGSNGGACNNTITFNITVNSLPTIIVGGSNSICEGNNAAISASGANTYAWLPNAITGSVNIFSPISTTTYTVIGTNTQGCTDKKIHTLTVNGLPNLSVSGNTSVCIGSSTSISTSGANTYNWQPGNLTGSINIVSPINTTTYSVTGTNSFGCTQTQLFTITVNSLPIISVSGSSTICKNDNATLNAYGANTYLWLPNSLSGTNQIVTPLATTTYTVTGTDGLGCVATGFVTVTVNSLPVLTVSGNLTICNGTTTSLSVAGAVFYAWQPGGFTTNQHTFNPLTTTSYNITGTDANNCVGYAYFTITVNICTVPGVVTIPGVVVITTPSTVIIPRLIVTNPLPVCVPVTVNITNSYIDSNFTSGNVQYLINTTTGDTLTNPQNISQSGTYYIKKSLATGQSNTKPVVVKITICVGTSTGISTNEPSHPYVVYPNPSDGIFNLEIPIQSDLKIDIYDVIGNQVFHEQLRKIKGIEKIDLSHFNSGIYFMRITDSDKTNTLKIILK